VSHKAAFRRVSELQALPHIGRVVNLCLDWNTKPLLLVAEAGLPAPQDSYNQSGTTLRNAAPKAHHVVTFENDRQYVVNFPDAKGLTTYHVQRYGEGWLLADSRGGSATIYDATGKILKELDLGDGSKDVQTTAQGNIWVSYFDEGVFGDGIGSAGLVCFDRTGKPLFNYAEWAEKTQAPFIDDCYALNVMTDDEVWLSYYSGFPLVRIKRFELENIWKEFGSISHGFAIRSGTVVYKKAYVRNQLFRCSLDSPCNHEPLEVVDQNGGTIEGEWTIAARGPALYLMTGSALYEMLSDE
jgi:hypothetical protein